MSASVTSLFLCRSRGVPSDPIVTVTAVVDRGLDGDRHARPGNRRSVLLMEQETVDQLGIRPGDVREQVTVRGLGLMTLAPGSRLRVGGVVLLVGQPCAPCEQMEALRPGLRTELEGRRGRFTTVLQGGTFAVGDTIAVEPPV
ncbi:MAG: MOSC domain-containing protein [Candidatus Eisenbacteria bacterium]